MRIAIVGGHNFQRYIESINTVENVEICFHDGIPKRKNKKCLEILIRDADYVIIVQAVCSHNSMWDAKAVAKKLHKTVFYAYKQSLSSILNTIENKHQSKTA